MKSLMIVAALVLCAGQARAERNPTTPVSEQCSSSFTVNGIAISSGTTGLDVTMIQRSSRYPWRRVQVQHVDRTSSTIRCSDFVIISTITGNVNGGFEVVFSTPNVPSTFILNPNMPYYCACDKINTTCSAVVGRCF